MSQLLFGTNFDCLELLAADIQVMLYVQPHIFYHFSLISNVFINIYDCALDNLYIILFGPCVMVQI